MAIASKKVLSYCLIFVIISLFFLTYSVKRSVLNQIPSWQNISSQLWMRSHQDIQKCEPSKSLIFAKTHKTGGSTVQNIFLRYGSHNNLTFVLPQKRTWMFSYKSPFQANFARYG